jgi:hypothetical protein
VRQASSCRWEELTVEKRKKEEDLPRTLAPIEELKAQVVTKMGPWVVKNMYKIQQRPALGWEKRS